MRSVQRSVDKAGAVLRPRRFFLFGTKRLAQRPGSERISVVIEPATTSTPRNQRYVSNLQVLTGIASLGFVLTGVVSTFLGPILPTLASRWELTDSQSGYFFALQFLGSVIGAGLSSLLLPKQGFRITIAVAHFLMAGGVMALILHPWTAGLMGTFIFGVGFGLVIPATNLLISNAHEERRAAALSILNLCWGLGALLTPSAVYFAISHGKTIAFVIPLGVLLVLQSLSFVCISTEGLTVDQDRVLPDGQTKPGGRYMAMVGGMFFLYVAIEASIGGWIATLARRFPAGLSGLWVLAPSLFYGGLLAGRGLAPLILQRIRERHVALSGLAVGGLGMFTLVTASGWMLIAAAGFFIGLGLAAVYPITIALLANFGGGAKRNAGPLFALAGLGGSIMPWFVGVVSTRAGSLQAGLTVPLIATVVLFWLHAVANHGSQISHD